MILEGIVTTLNQDGSTNVAPMGPRMEAVEFDRFELTPFDTSTTFANLQRTGCGVLHVTDDVGMMAQAAIGKLDLSTLSMRTAESVRGRVIQSACRYYEFRVEFADTNGPRGMFKCKVSAAGRIRDFFGFNRAMHAVLEGAILATRIEWIPAEEIQQQFDRLKTIVRKTGGPREQSAFEMLQQFLSSHKKSANRSPQPESPAVQGTPTEPESR